MDLKVLIEKGFGHLRLEDLNRGLDEEIRELETASTNEERLLELIDIYGYASAIRMKNRQPIMRDKNLEVLLLTKIGLRQTAYKSANCVRSGYRNPKKLGIDYDKGFEDAVLLELADLLSFTYSYELFSAIINL